MSSLSESVLSCLLLRRLVTREQMHEARLLCERAGLGVEDALVRLGYATPEEVLRVCAELLGLDYIDLAGVEIPTRLIEFMPESVARENVVLPIAWKGERVLVVAISDPGDICTLEKLQFILNRTIEPVLALREQIVDAINRHYGQSETESVDSMLVEFTDTAIDFTRTEAAPDIPLVLQEPAAAAAPGPAPRPPVDRRATVRYYHRMSPERMFPLLVVLSAREIREVVQRGVARAKSRTFQIAEGSLVEVEPVLPGCACYPPKELVSVGGGETTTTFWVVPHVLGAVMQARVAIRQDGRLLAEVPLQVRIVRQSAPLLMGGLSLVLPFLLLLLKHFKLDFESQLQEGFGLYAQIAGWLVRSVTPEVLTGLLLAATAVLYLCLRPRRRDVFWDVTAREAEDVAPAPAAAPSEAPPAPERDLPAVLASDPFHQPSLLALADKNYEAGDHARALPLYQQALAVGPLRARGYFRASLSAAHLGDNARALEILREAERTLPPGKMKGPLWYNMGCFAARLGRYPDAMRYLNRAVDAGCRDPRKYDRDADLEPLRWRPEFKRLLADLAV